MTITFTGAGTATAASGASPQAVTTAAALAVGDILVVLMAYDNSGTSGADPMAGTISVAPATGAVGASVSAQTGLNDPGAASAGLAVRCVAFPVTTAIPSGTVCNVSWSGTVVVRSVVFGKVSSTKTLTYRTNSGATAANVVGATTGTLVTPSVTNTEMVLCWAGHENGAAITADADSTNGSWSAIYGTFQGSGATGMAAYFQNKIVTATATQSFDPTGTSSDWIVGCLIFNEFVALAASIGGTSTTTAAVAVADALVGSSAGTSTVAGTLSASGGGGGGGSTWSDDFNRADGPLGSAYSIWTQYGSLPGLQIVSNAATPNLGFQGALAIRNDTAATSNKQFVRVTNTDMTQDLSLQILSTDTPTSGDGITLEWHNYGQVYWYVNGAFSGNPGVANPASGSHVCEINYDGTDAHWVVDGTVYSTMTPVPGVPVTGRSRQGFGSPSNSNFIADNASGGDIGGGAPVVYSDDFNRANGALGGSWAGTRVGIAANKGVVLDTSGGNDFMTFLQNLGSADHWVEADVSMSTTGDYMVINARRPDATNTQNGYLLFVNPGSGGAPGLVTLGKMVSNTYTDIAFSAGNGSTPSKIRLECQGSNIRGYSNGTKVIDVTDTSFTSGNYVGLNTGIVSVGSYDNFRCGALPYTPGPGPVALAGSSAGTSSITATLATGAGALYSDNFDRGNGAIGSPWVAFDGGLVVSSNKCISPDSGLHTSRYNQTFAADQWAEGDMVWNHGASIVGPCVRFTTGGDFYYTWFDGTDHIQVFKRVGGSYSAVGSVGIVAPFSFKARLEAQGTTLRLYINGVLAFSGTDSSISTGQPGILGSNGTGGSLDNYRCGDMPYTPVPVTPSVVATTNTVTGPSTSNVAKPAGGTIGDYYLIYINSNDWGTSPPVVTFPGFTAAPGGMVGAAEIHGQWFWKAYDGTEGSTFTNTGGNSGHWTGYLCFLVRGLPVGWTPCLPVPGTSTSSSPIVFPSVTVPNNTLMLCAYKDWNNGPQTVPGTWTAETSVASLTGYSQKFDTAATAGPFTIQPSTSSNTRSAGQQLFTSATSLPAIQNFNMAQNGTNSHVVSFAPAAAGDFLLVIAAGQVTHTASAGWTKGASAVASTELCVFYKTATAGESSMTLTHNGSNYPVGVSVIRFSGGGTYVTGGQNSSAGQNGDGPTLSGLSGSNLWVFAAQDAGRAATDPARSASWISLPVAALIEAQDTDVIVSNIGYYFSWCYKDNWASGTFVANSQGPSSNLVENIAFAVQAPAAGGGGTALAASSAGTSTASVSAMVAARSLAASVAGTSTQTSALAVARPLAATVSGTSSTIPAAPLAVAVALVGSAVGTSGVTATGMISTIGLSATVAGTSTATGAVAVAKALVGSAAGTSTVTSDLTRTSATGIFGNSTGVGTASGTLSVAVAHALVGSSTGTSTASASLAVAVALTATVPGVSTASGTMVAVARPLAASAAGTSSASGTLITTSGLQLVATVAGTSTASGSLSIVLATATGTATGTSTASADLAVARPLASTVAGASTAAADLTVAHTLATTVAGISTAAGNLIVAHTLVATVAGTSTTSAGLVVSGAGGLAAYVVGTSTAAGSLSVARPLTGSSAGSSTASGDLSRLVPLAASVSGTSTAVATGLSRIVPLAGSATGSSTVTASLRLAIALTGSADGVNTVVAAIAVAHALIGLSNGVGTANGDLFVGRGQFLSGTTNGKSTAVGALQVIFIAPVYGLWNGQVFDAMQYGDKAVTAWVMVPD